VGFHGASSVDQQARAVPHAAFSSEAPAYLCLSVPTKARFAVDDVAGRLKAPKVSP
jgi:hypothetical protein